VWAPGPVWTCAENLALAGIHSSDRPVHSESLCYHIYKPCFYPPGPFWKQNCYVAVWT
jgi:hypothetical protein